MANQSVSIVAGKLTPEEAERLAASFRPAWELDDAPFAQGSALSSADMAALEGGGVNAEVRAAAPAPAAPAAPAAQVATTVPKPAHVDASPPEAVIVDIEVDLAPAPVVQQPAPPPPRRDRPLARTQPRMQPVAQAADSGEYVPIKKSNKGLFIGIGAAVAVVVGIFAVRALTSEEPKAKPAITQAGADQPTRQGRSIPPPPPMSDIAPAATAGADKPAAVVDKPAPVTTTQAPVTPPTVTHATTNTTAPPSTRPTTAGGTSTGKPPSSGGTKPTTKSGGGGIVRDVQF